MMERVLFVDDDPNILEAYTRNLRRYYSIDTAQNGQEALGKLDKQNPYLVIVSDLRMPGMDGVEFLSRVREEAPDTIRMMLTGNADLTAAIDSVNKGNIFRFMVKPCNIDVLKNSIDDGIRQYNLVKAEKELLEKTLLGSVKMLTEILSLVNPVAFGRAQRVKKTVSMMVQHLNLPNAWKYEIAAMLSQVGCVTIPPNVLEKVYLERPLTDDEKQMLKNHPTIAGNLIKNIPRLEEIAQIIANQDNANGRSLKSPLSTNDEISIAVNILKIALDYDTLESGGMPKKGIIGILEQQAQSYYPEVLNALKAVIGIEAKFEMRSVDVSDLVPGMILAEDVRNVDGLLLIAKGQEITETSCQRLRNYSRTVGLANETIKVRVPIS